MPHKSRIAILREIIALEEKKQQIGAELAKLYQQLADSQEPAPAIESAVNEANSESNNNNEGIKDADFTVDHQAPSKGLRLVVRRAPDRFRPRKISNRDRILDILSDGRVKTTREIQEEMGQSTLNTTQSEVSRMVNETKELKREGNGVRLRREDEK